MSGFGTVREVPPSHIEDLAVRDGIFSHREPFFDCCSISAMEEAKRACNPLDQGSYGRRRFMIYLGQLMTGRFAEFQWASKIPEAVSMAESIRADQKDRQASRVSMDQQIALLQRRAPGAYSLCLDDIEACEFLAWFSK